MISVFEVWEKWNGRWSNVRSYMRLDGARRFVELNNGRQWLVRERCYEG